jgi:hypothetical protein
MSGWRRSTRTGSRKHISGLWYLLYIFCLAIEQGLAQSLQTAFVQSLQLEYHRRIHAKYFLSKGLLNKTSHHMLHLIPQHGLIERLLSLATAIVVETKETNEAKPLVFVMSSTQHCQIGVDAFPNPNYQRLSTRDVTTDISVNYVVHDRIVAFSCVHTRPVQSRITS